MWMSLSFHFILMLKLCVLVVGCKKTVLGNCILIQLFFCGSDRCFYLGDDYCF
ncbi:hypothetical protein I3843_10G104300 [Carya illinoinensis]|nr:hypothetical protein I3760_10G106900 [Carya illinoinensis]KAG7960085.1 hypothetical protein I3843_10G104300 [Carya illinoinensis]